MKEGKGILSLVLLIFTAAMVGIIIAGFSFLYFLDSSLPTINSDPADALGTDAANQAERANKLSKTVSDEYEKTGSTSDRETLDRIQITVAAALDVLMKAVGAINQNDLEAARELLNRARQLLDNAATTLDQYLRYV